MKKQYLLAPLLVGVMLISGCHEENTLMISQISISSAQGTGESELSKTA